MSAPALRRAEPELGGAVEALERAIAGARPEELPDIAGQLGRLDALLTLRLATPLQAVASKEGPDRSLRPGPAAKKLDVSTSWLARNRHRLPFTIPIGNNRFRYSEQGIEKWLKRRMG